MLLALRRTDPAEARLRELLAGPLVDDDLHAEALELLRRSPAMAEAHDELCAGPSRPGRAGPRCPPSPQTDALSQMCDVVVDRSA